MSRDPRISVELDNRDRVYRTGGDVTGRVRVWIDEEVECEVLSVHVNWRTRGDARQTADEAISARLFSGHWQGGREYEYPFSLRLPNGPCSYQGEKLSVEWLLTVRLEVPKTGEAKKHLRIEVKPADTPLDEPYRAGDPDSWMYRDAETRKQDRESLIVRGAIGLFCVTSIGTGLMVALLGLFAYLELEDLRGLGAIGGGMALIAPAGYFLYDRILRNILADGKLGDIDFEIDDSKACPGGEVGFEVDLPFFSSQVLVNAVTVGVEAREEIHPSGSSNRGVRRHQLVKRSSTIAESVDSQFYEGDSGRFETSVALPDNAPLSLYVTDNKLLWFATIEVDVEGWPDWEETVPLDVVPASSPNRVASRESRLAGESDDDRMKKPGRVWQSEAPPGE